MKEQEKGTMIKNKRLSQKSSDGKAKIEEKSLPTSESSPQEIVNHQLSLIFPKKKQEIEEKIFYSVVFEDSSFSEMWDSNLHLSEVDAIEDLVWRIELGIFNLNNKRKTPAEVEKPKIFVAYSVIKDYVNNLISENKIKILKVKRTIKYEN